ncbi:GntR family transcriptional regulator [Paenibacillus cremeus]|uniref:GntR family transcriptional regulator n=1 Tax=Paenibacillus cremeus TaxID=2163881 RepID=A0A559KAS8_9BACL|nr:GntR family transcriptional regulator [Paenibacillus cremeus]TVY09240.1 GntR family transcriptional regulator [Paenibacillus cremeus]
MEKMDLQIATERSISQKVAETLRKAIFRGDLKLGERLVEANVAKTLNVSITPVRQAFSQLATEGLIHVIPYKGTNVIQITETFIEEVYSIRISLELMAVELAFPRLTPADCDKLEVYAKNMDNLTQAGKFEEVAEIDIQFHGLFYERSEHALLLEIWNNLQSRIQLFQSYGRIHTHPVNKGVVENRHLKIVQAIRQGDLPRLLQTMKEHIEAGKLMVLNHYNRLV